MIGAGISGLSCARALDQRGCQVVVFEKSRGAGGRAATRRSGALRFDHGAQYLTVRDPRFAKQVGDWDASGVVSRWTGRVVEIKADGSRADTSETDRYVGVPGMSALGRALSENLAVSWNSRISQLQRASGGRWLLSLGAGDIGEFDAVVSSAPAAQSATLLRGVAPELARRCQGSTMLPCWAVMLAFEQPLPVDFDAAFVEHESLAWVARNSSKPGRPRSPESWVLHAGPAWSTEQLGLDSDAVCAALGAAFFDALGLPVAQPQYEAAHRWRYARSEGPGAEGCLIDAEARLAVCGDWLHGDRVEGAYLSGLAAAEKLYAALEASQG